MRVQRVLFVVFLVQLLSLACQRTAYWEKAGQTCDKTALNGLQNTTRWQETFGQRGAPGCLRISWGPAEADATGLYTRLSLDGSLQAYNPDNKQFDAPLQVTLPREARDQQRAFVFFAFGSSLTNEQQQRFCTESMSKATYNCQPDTAGECWFALRFQPNPGDTGLRTQPVTNQCEWQLPLPAQEPPNDGQVEPSPEPIEAGPEPGDAGTEITREQTPDLAPVEPTPETKDEPTPESQIEPIPETNGETPKEATPEQNQDIGPIPSSWAIRVGGLQSDRGEAIAVDKSGNVYITGYIQGQANFGQSSRTAVGQTDIYVAKITPAGTFKWITLAGGPNVDKGTAITVDQVGNTYITGAFSGTASFGTIKLTAKGSRDIFVAKLDANGTFLWAKRGGQEQATTNIDNALGVQLDGANNVYIMGLFQGEADFGTTVLRTNGGHDIFVAKLNNAGVWQWAQRAGSFKNDVGGSLAVTANGHVLITGNLQGSATFGAFALRTSSRMLFVAKLDTTGAWLSATKATGANNNILVAFPRGLTTDANGNGYLTGEFSSTAQFGSEQIQSNGAFDIFVAKIDKAGKWVWATKAGGAQNDSGFGITLDSTGNIYITGQHSKNASFGTQSSPSTGLTSIFAAKLNALGRWQWVNGANGARAGGTGYGIAVDTAANVYVTGLFSGTIPFGAQRLQGQDSDVFVWKIKAQP